MKNLFKTIPALLIALTTGQSIAQTTDVGVSGILSPSGSFCGGANDVVITVSNFGTNDVYSFSIDWSVDGIQQTQLVYLDTLFAGTTDTISLGNYNFPSAADVGITANTASPNGIADDDPSNDTLTSSGLSTRFVAGTYTIGGINGDYPRLSDAVTALVNYGICGSVIFDIRSTIDTVRQAIPSITGANSLYTITFRSEALNADSVKFTAPSETTSANPNYVLRLDGADYITFQHVTFERSGIEPYARVIEFRGASCFNTIDHCVLKGSGQNQVANSLAAVVYSSFGSPTNDSAFTITNNTIRNGSIGVYMNGITSLDPETGGAISGNQFIDQYARAIALSNQGSVLIDNNYISSNSTYTQYTAIELDRSQRNQVISKNRISGNVDIGMNLIDCSAYNGTPGIVSNNFIQASDSIGLRSDNGEYQLIAYNSINMSGSTSGTAAVFSGIGVGNVVLNNIFKHASAGVAIHIASSNTAGILSMDHNDFYTAGAVLGIHDGTPTSDLTAWKSINQSDTNSISSDPYFASTSSLYPTAVSLDGAATAIPTITDDIDGTLRDPAFPDIGAAEFVGINHDMVATAVLSPASGECGSNLAEITVVITNSGGAPETGFDYTISSATLSTATTYTYTDTIAPGASDTITAPATVNTTAGGPVDIQLVVSADRDDDRANDSLAVSININPVPPAPAASADSVCLGLSSTLTANFAGTISWYNVATGGTPIATGSPFSPAPLSSSTSFYATVTLNGCESDRTEVIATVLPLPSIQLGSNISILQGDTAVFDAGPGYSNYLWSTGATSQSIQVTDSGCYTVWVTNGFGCMSSDSVCLQLVLPADLVITSLVSPIYGQCAGTATPLSLQINNNGPNSATNIPVTITISGSASASINSSVPGPLAAGDSAIISLGTINTSAGGNLIVVATVDYNAEADSTNDQFTDTVFLPAEPPLPSAIDGGRCGTGPVILSASSPSGLPILWYDAPTGGVLVSVGTTYSIANLTQTTSLYLQSGTYCVGQSRQQITATLFPVPVINLGADTAAILPIVLDAGAGFTSYLWNTTETNQTINATQYGDYTVVVTDQNGCTNSDTITVSPTVGLTSNELLNGVRLFPNPSTGEFNLILPETLNQELTIEVAAMNGTIHHRSVILSNISGTSIPIRLNEAAKGIYLVKLHTETQVGILRLVIQ